MNTNTQKTKKILYVDMDNVLVDFPHGIQCLSDEERETYKNRYDECPDIFSKMIPMPNAIESYKELARHFDTYILSTSPWLNPLAWRHKLEWVQEHLGSSNEEPAYKRLILTHHKNLNKGDFLIDDRPNNGAWHFEGELIRFGTPKFSDWLTVKNYLMKFA